VLIAPNHPTMMDAPLLLAHMPRAVCVMKAGLLFNPVYGGSTFLARYITNDSGLHLVREARRILPLRQSIIIFPEGTRTVKLPINGLKNGIGLMAKATKAPVQTILIHTNTRFMTKGSSVFKKPEFPIIYRLELGKIFEIQDNENVRDFTARIENYYHQVLDDPWNLQNEKSVTYNEIPRKVEVAGKVS